MYAIRSYYETLVNANCFGDPISATINATGGTAPLSIIWQDGTSSFTNNNIPGNTNFYYTVTDANLCTESDFVYLNSPSELVSNPTYSNIVCFGDANGSIQLNISGGVSPYSGVWNNSSTGRITSYNVCYTKLLRSVFRLPEQHHSRCL